MVTFLRRLDSQNVITRVEFRVQFKFKHIYINKFNKKLLFIQQINTQRLFPCCLSAHLPSVLVSFLCYLHKQADNIGITFLSSWLPVCHTVCWPSYTDNTRVPWNNLFQRVTGNKSQFLAYTSFALLIFITDQRIIHTVQDRYMSMGILLLSVFTVLAFSVMTVMS